ncbi:MAG TPA: TolC family outer membrane protein [Aliidongia sp.]|uniref:TolC family outer membrane protein n=1 Tax=Aliidongia sp. TaxID=1914230 RepID=UPI002DDD3C76|nr:TolC family outer membrane protein [Aliidongia sp.]HEV2678059.1 TolC family outer membrane protein [Aliidongia sp.]
MLKAWALPFVALSLLAQRGHAESLSDTLADTYAGNATIQAQRLALRGTDERLSQAMSGWRPQVSLTTSITRGPQEFVFVPNHDQWLTARNVALQILQPLYRGGSTVAGVAQAKAEIGAGQAELSDVEQQQLFGAAAAYLDVYRDQRLVELSRNLVDVLSVNERNVRSTFQAGAATETDTSQAAARLEGAVASRLAAEGGFATSRASFKSIVGRDPGALEPPTLLGALPANEADAQTVAATQHPALLAARQRIEAAGQKVDVLRGQLLPRVDAVGALQHEDDVFTRGNRLNSATVGVQASVPLYEAGHTYSEIRAAREAVAQEQKIELQTERDVARQVTAAWNRLVAARAQQDQFKAQIEANQVAQRTTRDQVTAGTRTRLDLLNAEQELFSSRVNLVAAQHDTYEASFRLELAAGTFTPKALGLAVDSYDPTRHLDQVKDKWIGTMPPAAE